MKKERRVASGYNKVLRAVESNNHSNQFLHEGRVQMMEELLSNLSQYVNLNKADITMLGFCVVLVDQYRTELGGRKFDISTSGIERITPGVQALLKGSFNGAEAEAIGRNLFSIIDFSKRSLSKTQTFLVLADLFFIFQGPEEYERGLREYPAIQEERNIIEIATKVLALTEERFKPQYFLRLLNKLEERLGGLESCNLESRKKTISSIKRLRKRHGPLN